MSVDGISSIVRDEVLFVLLGNLVHQRDGEDQRRCLRGFQKRRSFDRGDDFTEIRVESL
jgi:hypothetical protein